jgi:hypothetical protein
MRRKQFEYHPECAQGKLHDYGDWAGHEYGVDSGYDDVYADDPITTRQRKRQALIECLPFVCTG